MNKYRTSNFLEAYLKHIITLLEFVSIGSLIIVLCPVALADDQLNRDLSAAYRQPVLFSVMDNVDAPHANMLLSTVQFAKDLQWVNPHPSDPSVFTQYGYCAEQHTRDGIRGKIYYPSQINGICIPVYGPVVLMLRGNGFAYDEYEYLLAHLAKNGIIAATIDVVATSDDESSAHQNAAETAWEYFYHFMWSEWDKRFWINPQSLGLIGHSRGGETVRYLAEMLANNDLFKVRAVIGLAPTGDTDFFINGEHTIGYLLLYGANDNDVTADQVFRHYDLSGRDSSQHDPGVDSEVIYKAMKLLYGGSHRNFANCNHLIPNCDAQRQAAKGYALAFIKAHLQNNVTWYEHYVRGNLKPSGWPDHIITQYSDGFLRRVIDNFDDGILLSSTIGADVNPFRMSAAVFELRTDNNSPHETHVLVMEGNAPSSKISWELPPGKRDATPFKWLSFRIGQVNGDAATDLSVQLHNGGTGWSDEVKISEYGEIALPRMMCLESTGTNLPCDTLRLQDHMGTIRIPLHVFGERNDVRRVRFRFRGDSAQKEFLLDNLEFSEWRYKP